MKCLKSDCVRTTHCHAAAAAALMLLFMQMMSEKTLGRPSRSLTMDSISPEDLPRQGDTPALPCHHIHWLPADSTPCVCFSGVPRSSSTAGPEVPGPVRW